MKAIAYFVAIMVMNAVAMPLGGLLHAFLTALLHVPLVGRVLRFVDEYVMRITVVTKFMAWCISASGSLAGFLLIRWLWGPPDAVLQSAAICLAAAIILAELAHRIFMFEFYDVRNTFAAMARIGRRAGIDLHALDPEAITVLFRRNFVDMNFIPVLRILTSFSLLLFGLVRVGAIVADRPEPTLLDCLIAAFSAGTLSGEGAVKFSGALWFFLRLFIGVVLLVWGVVFINVALDALPKRDEMIAAALGDEPSDGFD